MMQFNERVEIQELKVNEGDFKEILFDKMHELNGEVAFLFKSEVMHKISKKGFCQNYAQGYTHDDGTCMYTTNGVMLMNRIAYTIYPFDILKCYNGIESIITAIHDNRGVVKYSLPMNTKSVKRIYLLEYVK